ncbi:MAG: iron ABC transporter permease [Deltaproteobacteria bacterium]|nr:MAG: iron ABC transporter permease [Deltaproteobacteria bacterium]
MKRHLPLLLLLAAAAVSMVGGGLPDGPLREAVMELRLRRVISGAVVGAGLSTSGALMQCLLGNPLADPFLLGMSNGASLLAVAAVVVAGAGPWVGPAGAVGALVAAAIVAAIARDGGDLLPPTRLILAGVALAAVMGSLTTLLLQVAPAEGTLRATLFWTSGSLGATPDSWTVAVGLTVLVTLGWTTRRAGWMDRLLLGDEVARSLGVPTRRFRPALLGLAALLTGGCVAVGGLIGFVGLVAPHVGRLLWGPAHGRLLPRSALIGAAIVVGADFVARTALYPRELSVGVLTALLGGPVFLGLLRGRSYAFGTSP